MNSRLFSTAVSLALVAAIPFRASAGTLRGSPASMKQQHKVAVDEDLSFTKKPSQVETLVHSGVLVLVKPGVNFGMSDVSYPYARPEVLLFIERLSAQYRAENGSRLVVTSLVRPADLQPRNAHVLSVHPAGMAVDFRVPATATQRAWLENALLGLESSKVLDVTREKNPPHYHVAVFPAEYLAYATKQMANEPSIAIKPTSVVAGTAARTTAPVSIVAAGQRSDVATLILVSIMTLAVAGAASVPLGLPGALRSRKE